MSNEKEFDDQYDGDFEDAVLDEDIDADVIDAEDAEVSDDESWDDSYGGDDDGADESGDDTEKPARKKSGGKKLNMIIIVGALVVGAGIMGVTIFGGGSAPPAVNQAAPEDTGADLYKSGMSDAPSPVQEVVDGTPPMPVPLTQQDQQTEHADVLTPLPDDLSAEIPAPRAPSDPLPQMAEASPLMPQADDVMKSDPLPDPSPLPAPVEPAAMDTPAPALTENQASELISRLESVTGRLESLEQKVDGFAAQVTAVASAPASPTAPQIDMAAIESLKQSIGAIEERLETMNGDMAQARERAPGPVSEEPPAPTAISTPIETALPVEVPPVTIRAESSPPQAAPVKKAAAPSWVLKSAQPGKAMVARRGESEMTPVEVGTRLPGIGTILAIHNRGGGRWVVEGTDGQITN